MGPRPSIGLPSASTTRPRKPSPTGADKMFPVRRTSWPSSTVAELAKEHSADLAQFEVQCHALQPTFELEQFVGHGRGQPLNTRDAVTGLDHVAHLGARCGLRGVRLDELLQRIPDLVRPDREFRHCESLLSSMWSRRQASGCPSLVLSD